MGELLYAQAVINLCLKFVFVVQLDIVFFESPLSGVGCAGVFLYASFNIP